MTRNEALEKIREWAMGDDYNVNDHEVILEFFENELVRGLRLEYISGIISVDWDEEK